MVTFSNAPVSSPSAFWQEARYQGFCAVCDRQYGEPDARGHRWHAHHVVPKDTLRRLRLPQYDTRGALRLCTDCHMAFEWAGPGKIAVPVTCWTQTNVCYVWEVLGVTAVQLERKYGPLDVDERWVKHLTEECPLCQASRSLTTA